jgi:DNA-binding response OmpR family regulator
MSEAVRERHTVLIVDDEEDLRDIMRRMLERRGYSTMVAGDADEALEVCESNEGPIDVLITDLGLPNVSGGDLSRRAATLRPDLGIIYISGLPKDIAVTKGLITEDSLLVKKPFTSDLLLDALRTVLSEKPDPGGQPGPN